MTDLRVPMDPIFEAFGVPATVTVVGGSPVNTTVVWLSDVQDPQPFGEDLNKREPRRLMALDKTVFPTMPRGTVITAPERDGESVKAWKTDGLERVDADHWRVIVTISSNQDDMLSITSNGVDALKVQFGGDPPAVTRAGVRAMNRALVSGRQVEVDGISGDTGLKPTAVRNALGLKNATMSSPVGVLSAGLDRIPLIDIGARAGFEPSRGKGRGVTYKLTGSSQTLPHAFIAITASGHRGVFERVGDKRLPIRELFYASFGHIFVKFRPAAIAQIQQAFKDNFGHELDFARTENA